VGAGGAAGAGSPGTGLGVESCEDSLGVSSLLVSLGVSEAGGSAGGGAGVLFTEGHLVSAPTTSRRVSVVHGPTVELGIERSC
jgi:hypothetical protein